MRDDDDIWFDSLAGSKDDEPEKSAAAARAVRRPYSHGSPPRKLPRLARAHGAKRTHRPRTRGRAAGAGSYRPVPPSPAFLAAAVFAGLAVTVALQMSNESPTTVTRGAASGITIIRSEHPQELQQQLIRELRGDGCASSGLRILRPAGHRCRPARAAPLHGARDSGPPRHRAAERQCAAVGNRRRNSVSVHTHIAGLSLTAGFSCSARRLHALTLPASCRRIQVAGHIGCSYRKIAQTAS